MAKPSKSSTDAVAPVSASAPASSSSSKKAAAPASASSSSSKKAASAPAPVAAAAPAAAAPMVASAPEVAVAASSEAVVAAEPVANAELIAQSTEFLTKINQVGTLLSGLKSEFRALEKKWSRELKVAQKSQLKRKRKSGNRQPSGFTKPAKISDELAKFLEKPLGTEMARTEVTREINAYVKANKLQAKENGRKIIPDSKLQSLLGLGDGVELTFFNLQKYMKHHFSTKASTAAATA